MLSTKTSTTSVNMGEGGENSVCKWLVLFFLSKLSTLLVIKVVSDISVLPAIQG